MKKEELSKLSQEGLVRLMEKTLDSHSLDSQDILLQDILDELDSRTEITPAFDIESGWKDLQDNHPALFQNEPDNQGQISKTRRKSRRMPFIVAAIVAAILGTTVIAQAVGIDILGTIARWTEEVFYFEREPSETSNIASTSLYEIVTANDANVPLVPTWIPENLQQESILVDVQPSKSLYTASYGAVNGDGFSITIMDTSGANGTVQYEKDQENVSVYSAGGVDHYIMENMDSINVVWINENYECSISTNLSQEVIEKIIDSIYQ